MELTLKIKKAMAVAARLHKDQLRMDEAPYITHPFSVALILSRHTNDENLIAAALLHDVVEDTDYTEKELENDFGVDIKNLVMELTVIQYEGPGRDWKKQSEDKLELLKTMSKNALLVKTADKIHNIWDEANGFEELGEGFLEKFNVPIVEDLKYDARSLRIIKERLGSIPIVKELEMTLKNTRKIILG